MSTEESAPKAKKAKKADRYDPSQKFVAIRPVSRRPPGGQRFLFESPEDGDFDLAHLEPMQIKYLMEVKRCILPASEWNSN